VWLPAGVHRVELRYREPHLPLALCLGAAGLTLTLALALRGRRRTAQGLRSSEVGPTAGADSTR